MNTGQEYIIEKPWKLYPHPDYDGYTRYHLCTVEDEFFGIPDEGKHLLYPPEYAGGTPVYYGQSFGECGITPKHPGLSHVRITCAGEEVEDAHRYAVAILNRMLHQHADATGTPRHGIAKTYARLDAAVYDILPRKRRAILPPKTVSTICLILGICHTTFNRRLMGQWKRPTRESEIAALQAIRLILLRDSRSLTAPMSGEAYQNARLTLGLTQGQLATLLGFSKRTIIGRDGLGSARVPNEAALAMRWLLDRHATGGYGFQMDDADQLANAKNVDGPTEAL